MAFMKLLLSLFFFITVPLAATAVAQGVDAEDYINPDRPGIADGSNVIGAGRFQIETGFQWEHRKAEGNDSRTLFFPTLFRIGLDQRFEFRIEGNTYTSVRATDAMQETSDSHGIAPSSVGLKYHFIDGLGERQPSVGAIVRFFPRSGSGDFKTTRPTGDFRIVADWDFLPEWSLNPNVGVGLYEDDAHGLYTAGLFAATLNYNPSKKLNFFVDTGVQSPETRHGGTAAVIDAGTAYIVGQNIQLDLSAGTRVGGKTTPRLFLSAGISKRF